MIPRSDMIRHAIMGWGYPLAALRKHKIEVPDEIKRLLSIAIEAIVTECNKCAVASGTPKKQAQDRMWAIVWAMLLILKSYAGVGASYLTAPIYELGADKILSEIQNVCARCKEVLIDDSSTEK